MIGKNIRGLRHLWRVLDNSLQTAIITFRDGAADVCKVYKIKLPSETEPELFIFNNRMNIFANCKLNCLSARKYAAQIYGNIVENYQGIILYQIDKKNDADSMIRGIYLLPTNYEEQYKKFVKSNPKLFETISNKFGLAEKSVYLQLAYCYTDGSKNFFNWAINAYFKHLSFFTIQHIFLWNEQYGQLIKKLEKGTITAYTSLRAINSMVDEMIALRKEKRVNDTINSFNTAQKKMLKNAVLSEKDKEALCKFANLSLPKRINFIQKASSILDFDDFMHLLKCTTEVHFDWNKDSFMDYLTNVQGLEYNILYNEGPIVLLQVYDYETIKRLGKTTNWCITKNHSYWRNYMRVPNDPCQYMLFDFSKKEDDKLSIIGITTQHNRGITAAHDFTNHTLLEDQTSFPPQLRSFLQRFQEGNNIYSILQRDKIALSLVAHYDALNYKWSREGVLEKLYECVNKENVLILKDTPEKLVISVNDEDIYNFFGNVYSDKISDDDQCLEHILFFNFAKDMHDPNRLIFSVISVISMQEFPLGLYNAQCDSIDMNMFETLLFEFDLPYNIIKRPLNYTQMALNMWNQYEFEKGDEILLQHGIKFDTCLEQFIKTDFNQTFYATINYASLDMLKWFNRHRIPILQGRTEHSCLEIIRFLISSTLDCSNHDIGDKALSNNREKYLFDETLNNATEVRAVFNITAFKMIIEARQCFNIDSSIMSLLCNAISRSSKKQRIFLDEMVWSLLKTREHQEIGSTYDYYLQYAELSKNKDLFQYLSDHQPVTKQAAYISYADIDSFPF